MSQPPEVILQRSDTALLETLILQAPVAFAFYDTDLRYRRINRMLADINGLPMAEHVGRRPTDVLPSPLGEAVEERVQRVLDSGDVVSDQDFQAISPATGQLRHYETQWFPARAEDGQVIGVAVLVIDITERRRHEDALRRSTQRTAKLQQATASLAEALTVDQVCRVVRELAADTVDATETQVLLAHRNEVSTTEPHTSDDGRSVELALSVSGGVIGQLRMWLRRPLDEDDRIFVSAFAAQTAIALERARLFERERSTAVALQHSLLPERLPEVGGMDLAARFSPGSAEAEVGGDWYDAFTLPDGRLVLVVGDVMGKGVQAAAGMGRLRSALRALAHANPLPEAVLQGLDRVFSATEGTDQIATLVYILLDPRSRRAAVSGAGHLPLALVRAGAAAEFVDAGGGSTPLGWPEARRQRTLELGPGDLLLGFTDGLVERRGVDIDEGLGEVLALCSSPVDSAEELVERVSSSLMERTSGRDDATVLAVRFTA